MGIHAARGRADADREARRAIWPRLLHAVGARMQGPGGYYNLGNALALGAGIALQVAGTLGHGSVLAAVRHYLVGSPAATALTLAILIFAWSGEKYYQAWQHGFPPDPRLNWWGDFLSGVAAIVLTFALAAFGDLWLALASGLLLAVGKFGSALVPEEPTRPADRWPLVFRLAVFLSRGPAVVALLLELGRILGTGGFAFDGAAVMPAVMLVCYCLWARADILLLAPPALVPRPASRSSS